jgi:hypothetical protein
MPRSPRIPGTNFLLTHFERMALIVSPQISAGKTMADRGSLKLVGFIFATVTVAVMLTATMVVKGYADGVYTLEPAVVASR